MAQNTKFTWFQFLEICFLKDLICLEYSYIFGKMRFKCRICDHEFRARPDQITTCVNEDSRGGCPLCYNLTVRNRAHNEMAKVRMRAAENGVIILSSDDEYRGSQYPLRCKCADVSCGHIWEAKPNDLIGRPYRKGTGCKVCKGSNLRLNRNSILPRRMKVQVYKEPVKQIATYHNKVQLPVKLVPERILRENATRFGVVCPLCLNELVFITTKNSSGLYRIECSKARRTECSFRVLIDQSAMNHFFTGNYSSLCIVLNKIKYRLCKRCKSPVYEQNASCAKCESLASKKMNSHLISSYNDSDIRF